MKTIAAAVSAQFNRVDASLVAKKRIANHDFDAMSWAEKRSLAELVFGGHDSEGRRLGVYIQWIDGQECRRRKSWKYIIRGHLIQDYGRIPMSKSRQAAVFSSVLLSCRKT